MFRHPSIGAAVFLGLQCAASQAATLLVPDQFATIQAAIDLAVDGDEAPANRTEAGARRHDWRTAVQRLPPVEATSRV